jgi:hypothetical protein
MKPMPFIRMCIMLLPIAFILIFLENKRQENIARAKRTNKNNTAKFSAFDTSNTDYIFFQSISKYLSLPVIK